MSSWPNPAELCFGLRLHSGSVGRRHHPSSDLKAGRVQFQGRRRHSAPSNGPPILGKLWERDRVYIVYSTRVEGLVDMWKVKGWHHRVWQDQHSGSLWSADGIDILLHVSRPWTLDCWRRSRIQALEEIPVSGPIKATAWRVPRRARLYRAIISCIQVASSMSKSLLCHMGLCAWFYSINFTLKEYGVQKCPLRDSRARVSKYGVREVRTTLSRLEMKDDGQVGRFLSGSEYQARKITGTLCCIRFDQIFVPLAYPCSASIPVVDCWRRPTHCSQHDAQCHGPNLTARLRCLFSLRASKSSRRCACRAG